MYLMAFLLLKASITDTIKHYSITESYQFSHLLDKKKKKNI